MGEFWGINVNTVLMAILIGIAGYVGHIVRSSINRHLNRIDLGEMRLTAMDVGCEDVLGEPYIKSRYTLYKYLIEKDKLESKKR